MVYYTLEDSILKSDGKSYANGYWSQCYIIESIVLITVLVKALMVTDWITVVTFVGIGIMLLFHIIILFGVNYFLYSDEGSIYLVFKAPIILLIFVLSIIINLLPDFAIL